MNGLPVEFFNAVRSHFPGKRLTLSQVAGMNRIFDAWLKYAGPDVGNEQICGYIFATSAWETGFAMQPVKETQKPGQPVPTDAQVKSRLTNAWKNGKLPWVKKNYWSEGWFGRGDVQLTHEENYQGRIRAAVKVEFGVDIHANPDAVLRPDISAFILVKGVTEGWFTGKAARDYIDAMDEADSEDFREMVQARKVVNGQDKAEKIANLALVFEKALMQEMPEEKAGEPTQFPTPTGTATGQENLPGMGTPPDVVSAEPGKMAGQAAPSKRGGGMVVWWIAAILVVLGVFFIALSLFS